MPLSLVSPSVSPQLVTITSSFIPPYFFKTLQAANNPQLISLCTLQLINYVFATLGLLHLCIIFIIHLYVVISSYMLVSRHEPCT